MIGNPLQQKAKMEAVMKRTSVGCRLQQMMAYSGYFVDVVHSYSEFRVVAGRGLEESNGST